MALEWKDALEGMDWQALSDLYRATPLGEKPAADLAVAFANSRFRCFVYDDDRLIGAGRALADGVDCSYLCDVAVHPSHQGQGIGKVIVSRLVALSQGHKKIILYTFPGKEGFYQQLGFRPMTTALALFADPAQAEQKGLIEAA
ncbi:GNAT family N-acetyltransferase [Neisseriaceae bacterium JH1-16]|nr:GNAT family N-acetyltransferase [Neisseriaceae bacterium JH1-16]